MKVSVCTLSYNQKDYIAQCIESILSQKCDFDYELLIHDDASTDGTDLIIASYAEKYPDIIKPLYEKENQFSGAIKNISGIFNFPRARGEYIAMCEGDDYWNDSTKLQTQVALMDSHPDVSLCIHSAYQESTGVAISKNLMRPYEGDRLITPSEIIDKTVSYPTASLMMKAELLRNPPGFYMRAPIGDIPMQLIAANAGNAYYIDKPMCTYRYMAPGSWTKDMHSGDYVKKQETYAADMLRMYEGFDSYSKGRFKDEIQNAEMRLNFLTKVNIRDWNEIFKKENRKYLKELGAFENFSLRFEKAFPDIYAKLRSARLK